MNKEPVVVAPKFWPFSSHIFSQASQNVTVKVRVDRSFKRDRFTVNNSLHIEKTMSMLFVELQTWLLVIVGSSTVMIVALFLDHNCKSNFYHPL
jgi:ribosome-associated toxin RatA of RatAB toxin-antitoxin module